MVREQDAFRAHLWKDTGRQRRATAALDRYDEVVDDVLERSSLLEGLDLKSTPGLQEAVHRIGDNQQLPEWWAMRLGAAIYETQKGLEEDNAQQAAWGALLATTAWSMLVFIQQLEPLVWHGYQTYGVGVLQRVLDVWEDNQSTSNEEFWQSFFDEYPFIVSQVLAFPVVVVENKAYVGGKTISDTGGHIVDFLLAHQLTQNVALLEIKTPTAPLLHKREYRAGVHRPSTDLAGAIAQVATQRDSLLRSPQLLASHPQGLAAFNSHCVVVIGRTTELDNEPKRRSFELYRSHLAGITVITFDELFENIRGLLAVIEG